MIRATVQARITAQAATATQNPPGRRPRVPIVHETYPYAPVSSQRGAGAGPRHPAEPSGPGSILVRMDERVLAEKLIAADTSTLDGLRSAAGFVKGWMEARDIEVEEHHFEGLPILMAAVGAPA